MTHYVSLLFMTMLLVAYLLPPLVECFEQWWARSAVRVEQFELMPPLRFGFILWGERCTTLYDWQRNEWVDNELRWRRFLMIRTPFLAWDCYDWGHEYGWCHIDLMWMEGAGWRSFNVPAPSLGSSDP